MKIILIGYPGSQKIVPASKYLTSKYLKGFDITYLNYKGHIEEWSRYVARFLEYLTDEYVIFALDDYLVSGFNEIEYNKAITGIQSFNKNKNIWHCVKLCQSTLEEHLEYPVTTQYCIWDREYLIGLLYRVKTPWEFEIQGSEYFRNESTCAHVPCIEYDTHSCLSSRWEGIKLDGLSQQDEFCVKQLIS